jgi:hypothetical protein
MTQRSNGASTPITEQAAALVAEVERTLAEGDRRIREMGFDPEKVRNFGRAATPEVQRLAQEALAADLKAVDDEVAQAASHLAASAAPRPGTAPAARSGRRFV